MSPPTPRPASRPRQAAAGLTREAIIDTAADLIEREGPDALSMRRLGSVLGVEAMSIYHHVSGREELLAAIGDRMLEPLGALELPGEWRAACRDFAHGLREVARARPASFRLLGLQPLDTPAALVAVERLLGVLVAAGFAPAEALAAYRAVASYARGYALAEAAGFTVDAAKPAGRRRLRTLSAADFPILHGRIKELAELDADDGFEHGLRALLDGLPGPAAR